jgi:hypothetical protein
MPGPRSYFLIAIPATQNLFWIFQFTDRTVVKKVIINSAWNRFHLIFGWGIYQIR